MASYFCSACGTRTEGIGLCVVCGGTVERVAPIVEPSDEKLKLNRDDVAKLKKDK